MGDMGEVFKDYRDYRRRLRMAFGVKCPRCRELQPRREPSILLPRQKCRVDGYVDPRPMLTIEQKKPLRPVDNPENPKE